MKTKIKLVALFLMLFAATVTAPQKASANGISISFQVFYDELSPYGDWVFNPQYGYVWLPNVEPGFFPYATDGDWVLTDDGWTWVSYYRWGWAPFHYGRWFIDPYYGPMWVPGYEWGPGWVIWSRSGDYYGWAPMGPGISYDLVYGRDYHFPHNYWRFVRGRDFGRPHVYNYYVDNSTNITIVNNITVINNYQEDRSRHVRYNAGPDRHEVERRTGRTYNPVVIKESTKPGENLNNNELVIYKPRVERSGESFNKPAPSKVVKLEKTKAATYKSSELSRQKTDQPPVYQKEATVRHESPTSKPEALKQPQRVEPSGKPEAVKQPQRVEPSGKPEAVKQPQRSEATNKPEAVKQPQRVEPSRSKPETVKEPQHEDRSKTAAGGQQHKEVSNSKKVHKGG
jgi:hypothetical protein